MLGKKKKGKLRWSSPFLAGRASSKALPKFSHFCHLLPLPCPVSSDSVVSSAASSCRAPAPEPMELPVHRPPHRVHRHHGQRTPAARNIDRLEEKKRSFTKLFFHAVTTKIPQFANQRHNVKPQNLSIPGECRRETTAAAVLATLRRPHVAAAAKGLVVNVVMGRATEVATVAVG